MKRLILAAALVMAALASCAEKPLLPEEGFEPLFDGRSLEGWQADEGFFVEDGCIVSRGEGAGNIFTVADYGNYILRFDYMLSEVGNSGVLVRCDPDSAWETGFEVQLLAPWTPWRDDLHCTGSLYGHVPVTNRPDETTGVWHSMEIACDRKYIVVSVDGAPAAWAHMDQVESLAGKNLSGRIGFQGNHSDPRQWVRLRNIRLRDLDSEPSYVLRDFGSTDPGIRRRAVTAASGLGPAMVPGLCRVMASADSAGPAAAREALFGIAARASAPDYPRAGRDLLLAALEENAAAAESGTVSQYLSFLTGMLRAE